MFWKRRKRGKVQEDAMHPRFGLVRLEGYVWEPARKIKISLWDREFEIAIWFEGEDKDGQVRSISGLQEQSYDKFLKIMKTEKERIQENIMKDVHFKNVQEAKEASIPKHVHFSRKGECALFFENKMCEKEYEDELDTGFAIVLLPKIEYITSEYCYDCMSGRENTDQIQEFKN